MSPDNSSKQPLRVGIAGLGVVGGETARQLSHRGAEIAAVAGRSFTITAVSARSRTADRGFDMSGIAWVEDAADIAARDDVDIVVEMIGGESGVALDLVRASLQAGKHVVTANKALLAHHGAEIAALAEEKGVGLMFEAAVAGGIPAVKALREGLSGNRVSRVSGILNGTCNYILTRMEKTGEAFADVLADAQKLGYAEAEPSLDVDGIDAAHKLTILAAIAFGQTPQFDRVAISGIRDVSAVDFAYAAQLGFRIKLVGVAEPGRMPRMQTCLLPMSTQLAKVDGVLNAVAFEGEPVGGTVLTGPGAGAGPTSSAVLSDLVDIATGRIPHSFGRPVADLQDGAEVENGAGPDTPFYVRLMVVDKPGVLADVTSVLQIHGISVESLLQQGRAPQDVVALVMTTHEVRVERLMSALSEIEALSCVQAPPVAMPILVADQEG
ncbi:MAG: homoserine dehydrogenase [Pseudomonadota bacterium]|nr:homoserine dehydrogenase [Pseudomonadota bacterium]